jgi:prefoldin subunit 5
VEVGGGVGVNVEVGSGVAVVVGVAVAIKFDTDEHARLTAVRVAMNKNMGKCLTFILFSFG